MIPSERDSLELVTKYASTKDSSKEFGGAVFGEVHLLTIRRIVVAINPVEVRKGCYTLNSVADISPQFEQTLKFLKNEKYIILYDGPPMVAET